MNSEMAKSSGVMTSAFTPKGTAAEVIDEIWIAMLVVFGVIFLLVVVLMLVALWRKRWQRHPSPPLGDVFFIVSGGIAMPTVVLFGFLFYALSASERLRAPEAGLTIRVTGHMWWWEVEYPEQGLTIANEIYVPVGEPVLLELRAVDVIHSFWVPSLGGKTDLVPGLVNTHWLEVKAPGTYRGQCAEYCGLQHARMSMFVVALPPEDFQDWVAQRQASKQVARQSASSDGFKIFNEAGCAACHSIYGTDAQGKSGPDLTHMGSRLSIGAGTIPNNYANLAGWIGHPQMLKPGSNMPPTYIEPSEFRELVDYLLQLE